MRTVEDIAKIKARLTDPYRIEGFLTDEDVTYLVDMFEQRPGKVHKNTGPVTLDLDTTDPVVGKIMEKLKEYIGPYEITAAFFFSTDYPHVIHNDDTFELPAGVYKGITLPLRLDRLIDSYEFPRLCFFDQCYYHGPAKFFNGDNNIPTFYNKQLYEYSQVDGLVEDEFYDGSKLLTHLKTKWLKGLSLHSTLEWKPTSALVFDSVRLHCASDFRRLNIQSKLGISIFTKL